jgi:inorganic pyrophosphatase
VNFINVSGNINSIEIENSFSDALDVDFSNLDFKNIKIINALNDCVDFSAGRYNLGNLNLSKCGDKGLSIGEKSSVFLKRLLVNNANLGVATKDGSYLDLKFANMSNLKICVSAYNKKQEFTGGFIEIEKLNCEKYFKKADSDNLSKIFLEKKLIENNIYGEFYNPSDLKISKVEGKTIKKHLIKDFRAFNKDGSVNAAVEINSGIKEKWEISRISGYLSREFYMGSPRSIQHTPYPVNYGMIPRTILPVNRGGDGDPLDIIILGESLPQGKVVKVKPLGVMKMTDSGEQDDKIIAVPINSPLVKFNNLDHFKNEKPEVLNNIKEWFINYKGKNIVEFINFESDEEAKFIIKDAAKNYKRSGLKERS